MLKTKQYIWILKYAYNKNSSNASLWDATACSVLHHIYILAYATIFHNLFFLTFNSNQKVAIPLFYKSNCHLFSILFKAVIKLSLQQYKYISLQNTTE